MVIQIPDDTMRLISLIKSTMNKIDAQLSKCFLLSTSFYLVEANMQNNIIVPPFWLCLEAYSYPAMTFVTLGKINRSNRIGKSLIS